MTHVRSNSIPCAAKPRDITVAINYKFIPCAAKHDYTKLVKVHSQAETWVPTASMRNVNLCEMLTEQHRKVLLGHDQ